MDEPRRPAAERRFDPPVHHHALALDEPALEVGEPVEPDEEEEAVGVPQHDLEDGAPTAAAAALAHVGHLSRRGRLLADVQARERAERAPILVAKREMVERVLDGAKTEAAELGRALRTDPADRLDGAGQRLEGGGDWLGDRPVVRPGHGGRVAQQGKERVRAAEELLARRPARELGQDPLELDERRGRRGRGRGPRARHPFGERRKREMRLLHPAEVVGGEVFEGRRERPQQLGEGRDLAHARDGRSIRPW